MEVLNETGGREVPICDILTAQTAYMLAMYRHDKELQATLSKLVEDYTASVRSNRGTIGEHSVLKHCGIITNVKVGPYSSVVEMCIRDSTLTPSFHAFDKLCWS